MTEPRPVRESPVSPRALPTREKAEVRQVLNSERFADQPPREVYATLLDEGKYLCSPLRCGQVGGRCTVFWMKIRKCGNAATSCDTRHYTKPELLATQPNQLWSWDITKLLGPTKWTYYYLYNILDVFSRYSVGWLIAERESASSRRRIDRRHLCSPEHSTGQLTIHADRGSSMTSKPVALLMADLGVTKTHSRPHVSNDNPFSESQFKTLKYRPDYPERFGCQPMLGPGQPNSSVGTTTNITTAPSLF